MQTSPMTPFFGRSAVTTEMSAQTTPGLALRESDSPSTRPRTSFAASLQPSRGEPSRVTAPSTTKETEDEGVDQAVRETKEANGN